MIRYGKAEIDDWIYEDGWWSRATGRVEGWYYRGRTVPLPLIPDDLAESSTIEHRSPKKGERFWCNKQWIVCNYDKQKYKYWTISSEACRECLDKHLGTAICLYKEYVNGHPENRLDIIGELSLAERHGATWVRAYRIQFQSEDVLDINAIRSEYESGSGTI